MKFFTHFGSSGRSNRAEIQRFICIGTLAYFVVCFLSSHLVLRSMNFQSSFVEST